MKLKPTLKKYLFHIDCFGAPFLFTIHKDVNEYRTLLGGFYTIILVISTIAFSIARMNAWFTNSLAPLQVQYHEMIKTPMNLTFQNNIINIIVFGQEIPPNKHYFVPYLHQWKGESFTGIEYRLSKWECFHENTYCLQKQDAKNLILFNNPDSSIPPEDINYSIFLYKCKQELLPDDEFCASEQEIETYLQEFSYVKIEINLHSYDKTLKYLQNYSISKYTYLDKDIFRAVDIYLKPQLLTHTSGYPFVKSTKFLFLSDASVLFGNIQMSSGINKTALKKASYGQIYFQLDSSCLITTIDEQNFIDMLVMIYSFFRFLYSIGYLLFLRSEVLLKGKLIEQIKTPQKSENKKINEKLLYQQYHELTNIKKIMEMLLDWQVKEKIKINSLEQQENRYDIFDQDFSYDYQSNGIMFTFQQNQIQLKSPEKQNNINQSMIL